MPHKAQRISFEEGISRKDLKTIRQRFQRLHRDRLTRILEELRPRQQDFIELLPLLFHINHPMLPGYVKNDTPKGLPDYSPSRRALTAAGKLSRSFTYKRRAQRVFQLQAVYLMGSSGSIGQSSSSDFDLWLCHASDLNQEKQQMLQQKARLIEQASVDLGLELHIFLVDPQQFRAGKKAKLSRESSGSTQHSLLLEEFYRSAVLLAGRYPLWWLVPPEHELDYQEYADNLLLHRFVRANEVIDLGGLDPMPADEFFGAALWQLYKGIDSPYKSILKIFLMEAYSRDYPHPRWLAQQVKQAIYADETDLNRLDAYILLYQLVEDYLTQIDDPERLELARRCFYIKVGERLSRDTKQAHWRREMLFQLTREWGWGQTQLQMLDSRSEWKIDRVMHERNLLVGVLSRSYRLLTDFARNYAAQSQIDPQELNLLGRKLYTALDHRPGKIDRINPGISRNLAEPQLTLHYRPSRDGGLAWMLYRGQVDEDRLADHRPIKITRHLTEILLWSHINQVWGSDTRVSLYPQACQVSRQELLDLHNSLKQLFPNRDMACASMQALSEPVSLVQAALFINIGTDPLERLSKEGMQLTSNQHDPLSFASTRINLAIHLEELQHTSWGELLVARRDGEAGLLEALCNILNLQGAQTTQLVEIRAFSFSSIRGAQIAARVVELFSRIARHFSRTSDYPGRYIFPLGSEFFIIQQESKGYTWHSLESYDSLLEELQQPQAGYRALEFDPQILGDSPYPTLYRHNQPGVIQLFFHTRQEQMQIYLLDEQGTLFQQSLGVDSPRYFMQQQRRFLNSLQQLRNLLPGEAGDPLREPEFYELSKAGSSGAGMNRLHTDRWNGAWQAERRRVPLARPDDYLELTLVTDRVDAAALPLALLCAEREFNRLEYGEDLYRATASYLRSLRAGNEPYPIYLSSLRLSGLQPPGAASTAEMLNLKKRVEQRLNQT